MKIYGKDSKDLTYLSSFPRTREREQTWMKVRQDLIKSKRTTESKDRQQNNKSEIWGLAENPKFKKKIMGKKNHLSGLTHTHRGKAQSSLQSKEGCNMGEWKLLTYASHRPIHSNNSDWERAEGYINQQLYLPCSFLYWTSRSSTHITPLSISPYPFHPKYITKIPLVKMDK